MAYEKIELLLAIPLPMSAEVEARFNALLDAAKRLKLHARKINQGLRNEEQTTRAIRHTCHNDERKPCEPEQEI